MTQIVTTIAPKIARLATTDGLAARLALAALVTDVLRAQGFETYVVGGTAVDTYVSGGLGTSESYPAQWQESLDIDTVAVRVRLPSDGTRAIDHLQAAGFVPNLTRSSAKLPGVVSPVDLVGAGSLPDDYDPGHFLQVHVEAIEELGLPAPSMVGPEDLLFDYLESGSHMRHPRDWTRALAIVEAMRDQLDLGYLFTKAEWRLGGEFVPAVERVLRGEPLDPTLRR